MAKSFGAPCVFSSARPHPFNRPFECSPHSVSPSVPAMVPSVCLPFGVQLKLPPRSVCLLQLLCALLLLFHLTPSVRSQFLAKRPWIAPSRLNVSHLSSTLSNFSAANNLNFCLTPFGTPGECNDIRRCIYLILDLTILRQSVCFRNVLIPGVCCPVDGVQGIRPFKPANNSSSISPPASTDHSVGVVGQTDAPTSDLASSSTSVPMSPSFASIPPSRPSVETNVPATTRRPSPNRPMWSSKKKPPPSPTNSPQGAGKLPVRVTATTTSTTTATPEFQLPPLSSSSVTSGEDCGISGRDARIVGGEDALPGQWPWVAAIFMSTSKGVKYWCGGALINHHYVLTAAHCLSDHRGQTYRKEQVIIKLGEHDIHSEEELPPAQTFQVVSVLQHPNFKRHGFYNDICLLKLDRPVRYSETISPICLPDEAFQRRDLVGFMATVIGWGTTKYGGQGSSVLQQVSMPVWDNEDCDRRYSQKIDSNFLCSGFMAGGKDACQGDSGSPLMLADEMRKWTIIGVVSFGSKCAQPGFPGVYTRVAEYLKWIRDNSPDEFTNG